VVKCSDVSDKHAASIFRVIEFIWLDAAVIRRKSSYTVDNVPPPFFGIEPNQFSQPEDGGSMFSRNVGAFNYYKVQKPKSMPSYEAL